MERRRHEERLSTLLKRLHERVDDMFDAVEKMLDEGASVDVNAYLMPVEEIRRELSLETLMYIARWQPLGRDLVRAEGFISASYDLYRIARYLWEIVRLDNVAGPLAALGIPVEPLRKARKMVDDAVRAFINEDATRASKVNEADREVDVYYEESLKRLKKGPLELREAVEALFARHIERIADHATYIASYIAAGPPKGLSSSRPV